MNLPDRELLELNELCQALIDGAISDADRARLEKWLASSEEARRFYVRTMALSASLFEYAGEMQSEAPEPRPVLGNERPARGLWWTVGSLAAAAMLMLGVWFGRHAMRNSADALAFHDLSDRSEMSDLDDVVAHLSASLEGKWKGAALAAGEELHRGQQLQLASGLVEIAFDSGAVVTLEGPAALQLTSAWEAVLHRGTLKAQVPKEAIGFRVSNPAVEVVDLGTEFSMVTDDRGATEVFVLKGSVETRAGEESQPLVLREREARRFAKGKRTSEVADRDLKWRKLARLVALERTPRPLHFLHCSFDVDAAGNPLSGQPWSRDPRGSGPTDEPVVPGRFGQAFQMSATSHGALELNDELRGAPVQTVAFWLKVPLDAGLSESRPIVSWSRAEPIAARVAMGWNGLPGQGPLGALRTSVGRAFTVGETSVRDEQWHHVAVIFTPARRHPEKLQVRQYVDGRLDGVSMRRMLKRGQSIASAPDDLLWLGRASDDSRENFHGAIDELYVIDRALSPQEIHQLMEKNELPGGSAVL
jgi:ferric-dicitrate binding protein FerR (iron transport regulator)